MHVDTSDAGRILNSVRLHCDLLVCGITCLIHNIFFKKNNNIIVKIKVLL